MRTVAALSLVFVVLLGGVVTGSIITDGGDNLGLSPDAGPGDEADRSAHGAGGGASTPERARSGQQYDGEPAEHLQQNQTATPTPTPTPTPTQTPQQTQQQPRTPTPTPTQTPQQTQQQPRTPTPTPTQTEDDGWDPIFGDDDTPTPTPTARQTATPSQSSADFRVVDAGVDNNQVAVGEYVEVTAMVENRGQQAGTYEAQLQIDGETLATENVFVEGGAVETVTFQVQFQEPGRYDLAVSGTRAGTVSVSERQMEQTGDLEVIDAVVPADVVRPGVETTVRATVENPNDREIEGTLNVTVDGEQVAQRSVTLGPGERTEVTIPFEAKQGTVAVNGVEAGDLQVSEEAGGDGNGESGGSNGPDPNEQAGMDLGYLLLAAAIIVAGAILVAGAVRWRSDDSMMGTLEERRR